MGDEFKDFNYGVRYISGLELGKMDHTKKNIFKKIGGTDENNKWWASNKPFIPSMYQNWNNDVVFERLYDGTIKKEIKNNVIELCKDLEGIDL